MSVSPVVRADEEVHFVPDVNVGWCLSQVEEQVTGPVHAADEAE